MLKRNVIKMIFGSVSGALSTQLIRLNKAKWSPPSTIAEQNIKHVREFQLWRKTVWSYCIYSLNDVYRGSRNVRIPIFQSKNMAKFRF